MFQVSETSEGHIKMFFHSWNFQKFNALPLMMRDIARSVPDFLILLWLTPDDFTRQGRLLG